MFFTKISISSKTLHQLLLTQQSFSVAALLSDEAEFLHADAELTAGIAEVRIAFVSRQALLRIGVALKTGRYQAAGCTRTFVDLRSVASRNKGARAGVAALTFWIQSLQHQPERRRILRPLLPVRWV